MTFRHFCGCRCCATVRIHSTTLFFGILVVPVLAGVAAADSSKVMGTADRLINEAGQAKIDGKAAVAYALLHEAVRISPENTSARGELGQVKVGNEWLSVEEAERRAEADPLQAKYRERRQALGETPRGQLALARWCRGNDLTDEAQFHWASVLSVDPSNREALRSMGVRWHDGQLKSSAEIKESKRDSTETKQAARKWVSRVSSWMRALGDKYENPPAAIVNEIRAVDDLAAIPAFEAVTLNPALSPKEKNPAPQRLSLAFMGALAKIRDIASTNSLMRHAVRSPFEEVRTEATAELRKRPLEDFVPTLLDNLSAPLQSAFEVIRDPDGSVHYVHSVYREGAFADWSFKTKRSIYQPWSMASAAKSSSSGANRSDPLTSVSSTPARAVSSAAAARSAQRYQDEIIDGEMQVAQTNLRAAAVNEPIYKLLSSVTGKNFESEPRPWWDWWKEYTDYYASKDRPTYSVEQSSSDYVVPPPPSSVAVECFARGTPVWTKTGQRPIESLEMGDLVLSQNVDTGEMKYKPVIARTLRPAGPIVQISMGGEKILATRGHPLWVDGVGWRMSKELGDGAVLHSLAGSGRIGAIGPATETETYNLVVADFNTYFVGKSGILAHDNTPRRPTQSIMPGIRGTAKK